MRSILISIKPQWVEKILSSEKTIEIRKTMPKCKLPCKVYIYCSKGQELWGDGTGETWYGIDENEDMQLVHELNPTLARLDGKVVAEFTLKEIRCWRPKGMLYGNEIKKTCLTMPQLIKYAETNKEHCYAWSIDNLKIYDKPFPVRAFTRCDYYDSRYEGCCDNCHHAHISYPEWVETREDLYDCEITATCCNHLKKAPQSWCYVEELHYE